MPTIKKQADALAVYEHNLLIASQGQTTSLLAVGLKVSASKRHLNIIAMKIWNVH